MTAVAIGDALARVNAVLNSASFVLLVLGFIQIKKRRLKAHETCMKLAFLTSALFLVSYLTRYALTGSHHIAATGLVHGLTVVTRNRVDFEKTGLSIVDPFG